MPTISFESAFRVLILNPPREHGPAHVHVWLGRGKGATEVLIALGEPKHSEDAWGPISVREVRGMRDKDVVAAVRLVEAHRVLLRTRWREVHVEG